jgi:methyltransferase (TIGR00027 family)
MIETTASRTALMVAAYRARATRRPEPICRDEWASQLAGALGLELSVAFDRHVPHMEMWIGLRTAWLDRQIQRLCRAPHGFDQVVLLGAGFDTRAARLAQPGVRFFEVDHPATQAEKRARLAELGGYPLGAVSFVACDFESGDDFADRLVAGGFAADRPAVVIWEGVTPYLTEDAVRATATRVATALAPASALYFDYVGKRMAEGDNLRDRDRGARDEVARVGEPIRWGTSDPLPLLAAAGFRHVRTMTFDAICLALTGTYERAREFRFQSIAAASVTTDALF